MAKEFNVGKDALGQIAQSVLEMKKMARSIENSADAFYPLTTDTATQQKLSEIVNNAQSIATITSALYRAIAQEALQ